MTISTKTDNQKPKTPQKGQAKPAEGFFYEVSWRPNNRRKKMFAPAGTSLTTPSGGKVPPAWTDVWMTTDRQSDIQAMGRDSQGRRVYLYSVEHMGKASAAKFSRLKAFGKAYPKLLKHVERDMKTKEEALVLHLIAKTGFRIGSHAETRGRVKAFGASTLLCSHVAVQGAQLSFDFTGKKGVRVNKILKDRFLAKRLAERCDGSSDHPIFNTSDDEIRAYLSSLPGCAGFTVKDFRTYRGTLTAFRQIKTLPPPRNSREYKKYKKAIGQTVAGELGNTPTIALKSYVSPEVFCVWESGSALEINKTAGVSSSLADEFLECVHYDQDIPMEEYLDTDLLD